jgi:ribosomal protein S18 acetylase RimI-like enzyme
MGVLVYRPARPEDLEIADRLVVASINALTERHGFGPMATPSPPLFQLFSLQDDPAGLWVAEQDDQILGFAFAWACADLWFLAQLFVAPNHQGGGMGNALLRLTLEHAQTARAETRALITFAFNRASQGLYIRHGLYPRFPIYFFSMPRENLRDRLPAGRLRVIPLDACRENMETLARIDIAALGVTREKHHRFLLNDGATLGFMFYAGEDPVGYAYVAPQGHIGPLAVARPDMMEAAFSTALGLAAQRDCRTVSAFLPGKSEATLRIAVEHGMRITFPLLLMSTREFGDWTRYLPRNPGFM